MRNAAFGLALLLLLPASARAASSQPAGVRSDCGSSWVTVVSDEASSLPAACEGFSRAERFMAERGYPMKARLTIHVLDRFPESYRKISPIIDNVHGFYDTDTDEVYIKTFRVFAKTPPDATPLGVAPSRELWTSYIAHEAGHHISIRAYAAAPKLIPREQGEFISYALQLATMAEPQRKELVRRFKAEGRTAFESADQIQLLLHDMDPQGFAVRSYLFFITPAGEKALTDFMSAR
ncbi:MAG: hypothetical protein HY924_06175 [Elusimicrobia bacterium]|nr:hypothetical protein [Elusimicrobiota bacterium]